jgi:hypothetical protein
MTTLDTLDEELLTTYKSIAAMSGESPITAYLKAIALLQISQAIILNGILKVLSNEVKRGTSEVDPPV